ncbi:radical SAM protein [Thalassobaculum litoreum]|uniref:Radical SAM additional 4Fe4S-binding SPASM domain-containing protein n=1 Tax=Thalassobaculum litoreum DSM 18839 TaxID=1123362 RepID=A0A8G2BMR9_9PROT|nr:radical SAM protein [Thalassobaculum litoreum]SDG59051.1 radical SAM additional 4Fe4S-binding SPASM domain-containing protein [Thalassobaculum litoreum DSM 18839]
MSGQFRIGQSPLCHQVRRGDHINVIFKLTGATCNLDCCYCFEKRRDYPSHRTIGEELVSSTLSQLAAYELSIELHGGEPLLVGLPHFTRLLDLIISSRPDVSIRLQTNGTLISEGWCNLFLRHPQLSVGVSLDGFQAGNHLRYDNRERDSTGAVLAGMSQLERHGIDYGLIRVCSKDNVGQVGDYLDLAAVRKNVKVVRLLPCFDDGTALSSNVPRTARTRQAFAVGQDLPWSISFEDFASEVMAAYDHWRGRGYFERFLLDPAIDYLKMGLSGTCASCHFEARKCFHTIAVYPDGTFSLCDELDDGARWPLTSSDGAGNIPNIIEGWTEIDAPLTESLLRECEGCDVRALCNGGCIAIRRRAARVGRSEAYCQMQRTLFDHFSVMA